ncbi:hypothetical protein ACFU99_29615, partial [Streptomyces sp. NPDC057654]
MAKDGFADIGEFLKDVVAVGPDGDTSKLTIEIKNVYTGPDGEYHRTVASAIKARQGKGQSIPDDVDPEEIDGFVRQVAIPEPIFGVAGTLPGENYADRHELFRHELQLEQAFNGISGEAGSAPGISLQDFLPEGWTLTEEGEGWKIGPRPIGDWPGSHDHFNEGVRPSVGHSFLRYVYENTWRDQSHGYYTRDHLGDALKFADLGAAGQLVREARGEDFGPEEISDALGMLDGLPDAAVQARRFHDAVVYVTAAMMVNGRLGNALWKAHAAVLPRHELHELFEALPERTQNDLQDSAEERLKDFDRSIQARIPDAADLYYKLMGLRKPAPDETVQPLDYNMPDFAGTVEDLLRTGFGIADEPVSLEEQIGLTKFPGLDAGKAVMELRSIGKRHVTARESQAYDLALSAKVQELEPWAERLAHPAPEDLALNDEARRWLRLPADARRSAPWTGTGPRDGFAVTTSSSQWPGGLRLGSGPLRGGASGVQGGGGLPALPRGDEEGNLADLYEGGEDGDFREVGWGDVQRMGWYGDLHPEHRERLGAAGFAIIGDFLEESRNTVVAAVDGSAGREEAQFLTDALKLRDNLSAYDPEMVPFIGSQVQSAEGLTPVLVRGPVSEFGRHVPFTEMLVPHPGPWARMGGPGGLAGSIEHVLGPRSKALILTDNEMNVGGQAADLVRNIEAVNEALGGEPGYIPLEVETVDVGSAISRSAAQSGRDQILLGGVPLLLRHSGPFKVVTVTRGAGDWNVGVGPSSGQGLRGGAVVGGAGRRTEVHVSGGGVGREAGRLVVTQTSVSGPGEPSASRPVVQRYEIAADGAVTRPDGQVLYGQGWLRQGLDFVHDLGGVLRGGSGVFDFSVPAVGDEPLSVDLAGPSYVLRVVPPRYEQISGGVRQAGLVMVPEGSASGAVPVRIPWRVVWDAPVGEGAFRGFGVGDRTEPAEDPVAARPEDQHQNQQQAEVAPESLAEPVPGSIEDAIGSVFDDPSVPVDVGVSPSPRVVRQMPQEEALWDEVKQELVRLKHGHLDPPELEDLRELLANRPFGFKHADSRELGTYVALGMVQDGIAARTGVARPWFSGPLRGGASGGSWGAGGSGRPEFSRPPSVSSEWYSSDDDNALDEEAFREEYQRFARETSFVPQPAVGFGDSVYGPRPEDLPVARIGDLAGGPDGGGRAFRVVYRVDVEPLFRWDSRPPEVIFGEGFRPHNDKRPVSLRFYQVDHIETALVSTSRDGVFGEEEGALPAWAVQNGVAYRYHVDAPGGYDFMASLPRHAYPPQQEVAFWKGIRPEFISRVTVFDGAGNVVRVQWNPGAFAAAEVVRVRRGAGLRLDSGSGSGSGGVPTGELGREDLGFLVPEVRRELGRLMPGVRYQPSPDEVARFHAGLDGWVLRQPMRARGEAIAQTIVNGQPVRLRGGASGGPRRAVAEMPVGLVPEVRQGMPAGPFVVEQSAEPSSGRRSAPVRYAIGADGDIRHPDGRVLHAQGWNRQGLDFVHDTGARLHADTGEIDFAEAPITDDVPAQDAEAPPYVLRAVPPMQAVGDEPAEAGGLFLVPVKADLVTPDPSMPAVRLPWPGLRAESAHNPGGLSDAIDTVFTDVDSAAASDTSREVSSEQSTRQAPQPLHTEQHGRTRPPVQPGDEESHFAPPSRRPGAPDPIRDWERLSSVSGRRRSNELRAIDDAVRRLPAHPGERDLRRVLSAVDNWRAGKSRSSHRWEVVSQLRQALKRRLEEFGSRPAAEADPSSQRAAAPANRSQLVPLVPVPARRPVVNGYGPADGFEAELRGFMVVLAPGDDPAAYGDVVSLPGLLTITLDKFGGVPVLEVVSDPSRGLQGGMVDGRAERADVFAAFDQVLKILRGVTPERSIKLGRLFPASLGYVVDELAADMQVKINPYSTNHMLVHHTATSPLSELVEYIRHVKANTQTNVPQVQQARADADVAIEFGRNVRGAFRSWVDQNPNFAPYLAAWDADELRGALT